MKLRTLFTCIALAISPGHAIATLSLKPLWTTLQDPWYPAKSQFTRSLVVAEQRMFVTQAKGRIAAYQLSNDTLLWQRDLHMTITSEPVMDKECIILAAKGALKGKKEPQPLLLALDAATGKTRWAILLPECVFSKPAVGQGFVVIKTSDQQLFAWQLSDGQLKWTYPLPHMDQLLHNSQGPQIIEDKVISGFADGTLRAINLSDGALLWKTTIAHSTHIDNTPIDISGGPLVEGNAVYAASFSGEIAKVSFKTGMPYWRVKNVGLHPNLVLGSALYITDQSNTISALDPTTGQYIWTQKSKHPLPRLTAPALTQSHVVVADHKGRLLWFSRQDGQLAAIGHVERYAEMLISPATHHTKVYAINQRGALSAWELS